METAIAVIVIIVVLAKVNNVLTGRRSSPVTVMDARADRFEIEKEIFALESFIDEMEMDIKELDQNLSRSSAEEQDIYAKELEEKLLKRKFARDELRDKKWELHEAKKKVFREEMFETM